ncbi:MAG: DUF3987 domain-containing protein [Proteobacteria bacterium]|nr:DUF3987 domain-containing protein [Pseudomonadota bacterium]
MAAELNRHVARIEAQADRDLAMLERAAGTGTDSQIRTISSAPEPLRRPLPPASPYPLDALGPVLGGAARRLHEVVQAPAALCGQSVLAAAALAAQGHADVVLSGTVEPTSLWLVSIAVSGERKSAVDRLALRAHDEHERAQLRKWDKQMAAFRAEEAAHQVAIQAAKRGADKVATPGAIKAALDAIGEPPKRPLVPLLMVAEPTVEGLHKAYKLGEPSVGLFNDDAGDFLGGHAMNDDNRVKSSASLSKLWDRGQFDRVRAGDGAGKFFGRRLAMHLMMQPVVAESVLSDDVLVGQGFLARCLLAWPESTIGTREYQDVDLTRDPVMRDYWQCMRGLLERPLPKVDGAEDELRPRVLRLEPSAMAHWIEIKNAVEHAMRPNGTYAGICAWASKAASQAARVAGALTLVDDPDAASIGVDAVERAATLMTFHLDEAARIVGTAAIPAAVRRAEAIVEWCRRDGREFVYSSQALQFGPGSVRTRDNFTEAMKLLVDAGWAVPVDGGMELDGKHRSKVWRMRRGEP